MIYLYNTLIIYKFRSHLIANAHEDDHQQDEFPGRKWPRVQKALRDHVYTAKRYVYGN